MIAKYITSLFFLLIFTMSQLSAITLSCSPSTMQEKTVISKYVDPSNGLVFFDWDAETESGSNESVIYSNLGNYTRESFWDISYTSDGKLYGVVFNVLAEIDPVNGKILSFETIGDGDYMAHPNFELVGDQEGYLYTVDAAGGRKAVVKFLPSSPATTTLVAYVDTLGVAGEGDLAWSDGFLYWTATTAQGNPSQLVKIDVDSGDVSSIMIKTSTGATFTNADALFNDSKGNLYFAAADSIYNLDKTTGTATLSHTLNYKSGEAGGATTTHAFCASEPTPVVTIAEYRFDACIWDGTSGEVKDSSGHGFDGNIINGAQTESTGQINRSGNFTGDYDAMKVEGITGLDSNDFTLSFWTKIDSQGGSTTHELIKLGNVNANNTRNGDGGVVELRYRESDNELRISGERKQSDGSVNGYSQTVTVDMDDAKWHHIVLTYTNENMKIFVDSAQGDMIHPVDGVSGISNLGILDDFNGELRVGNSINGLFNTKVNIDEVKIYNSALSDEDISTIHNNEKAGKNADGSERDAVECGVPFTCDDTMYFSNASRMGTEQGTDESKMWLHKINREQTPFAFDVIGDVYNKTYNALAYNPVDNFLYATYKDELIKIDRTGKVSELGKINKLADKHTNNPQHYAATFGHKEGNKAYYYLSDFASPSNLYKIDVETREIIKTIYLKKTMRFVDMTIDESGEYIYAIRKDWLYDKGADEKDTGAQQLVKIKIADGSVQTIGDEFQKSLADTIFCDVDGKLYVLYHEDGFYEFDASTGERKAISNAPVTTNLNDGAMCPNATVNLLPIISIGDVSKTEGDSGTQNMVFSVNISGGKPNDVTYDFKTVDISAKEGEDYEKIDTKGMGNIINVPIKGDTEVEPDEQFKVVLSNVKGALYHDNSLSAVGTILNDDGDSFTCEENAYLFSASDNWKTDNDVNLSLVNFENRSIDFLAKVGEAHINAAGYSVDDDFLYGIEGKSGEAHSIVKIDKNYNVVKRIALPEAYSTNAFADGDVQDGIFYFGWLLKKTDYLYRYDIKNDRFLDPIEMTSESKTVISDFAFNIKDKKLYGVDGTSHELVRINLETKKIDFLGKINFIDNVDKNADNAVITFFDKDGNFYFSQQNGEEMDIYKLFIGDGSSISLDAEYYQKFTGPGSGDGARCADAAMRPDISIDDNLTITEGDSGTKTLNIRIKLDKPAIKDVTFYYETLEGSASKGSDYVYNEGSGIIKKGESETVVGVEVVGDLVTEANEEFLIKLSKIYGAHSKEEEIFGICHILDNDYTKFDAYNKVIEESDRKITTQIVGRAFDLNISMITGSSFDDVNETKAKIVENSDCVEGELSARLSNEAGYVPFSATLVHFPAQSQASKEKRVQLYWYDKLKNVYRQSCSSDSFSIRPKNYMITLTPSTGLKAGEDFNITIEAKDESGNVVTSYNEAADVYALDYNDTKVVSGSTCSLGTLSFSKVPFVNGEAKIIAAKYDDVGALTFKVKEVDGKEFALVDKDDTADSARFISPYQTNSVEFTASKIVLDATFESDSQDQKYVFYAGDETDKMAAKLKATVSMQDAHGNLLSNFKEGCYAKDVSIKATFSGVGEDDLVPVVVYDGKKVPGALNWNTKVLAYDMNSSKFVSNGEGNMTVKINFERAKNEPKNPMQLKLYSVTATQGGVTMTKNKSNDSDAVKNFIYLRANVPSPQAFIGKEANVTVSYEVYMEDSVTKNAFGLENLKESEDMIRWFKISAGLSNDLDFEPMKLLFGASSTTNTAGPSTGTTYLGHTSSSTMTIQVPKLPFRDTVLYKPSTEYLKFDPYNGAVDYHKFKLSLSPDKAKWTGRGEEGLGVDLKSSKRHGDKIDW